MPAADRRAALDPRARGRGAAPAAGVPRREVAGGPAALRARRPARGRRRQHRQLRRRHVHGAGRHRQRRRPGRRLRRGDRRRRRPPVQLRPRGRRRLRGRGRGGDAPGADVDDVVDAALALAHDGTRAAIEAVVGGRGAPSTTGGTALAALRAAVAPYDTVGPDYRAPAWTRAAPAAPSRSRSCRSRSACCSSPAATTAGAVLGAVNYGRDADSIATMAGAIAGALGGPGAVPAEWAATVGRGEPDATSRAGGRDDGRRSPRDVFAKDADRARPRRRSRRAALLADGRRSMSRLTWVAAGGPAGHELVPAADEGKDVDATSADRWIGGRRPGRRSPPRGASAEAARPDAARARARAARRARRAAGRRRSSPSASRTTWQRSTAARPAGRPAPDGRPARTALHGAWTRPRRRLPARQAGREDPARRASGRSCRATGRWPLTDWFTAVGLPDDVAARWPWNRRSAPTSLAENIDGMPEDDDLNFPLLALDLLERHGAGSPPTTSRGVAGPPARRPRLHRRAGGVPQLLLDATPPATATAAQPVPRVDRRADPHRRLRLGHPGDPAAAAAAGVDGRPAEPHPQRRVRRRCSPPRRARGRGVDRSTRSTTSSRPGCRCVPPRQPVRRGHPLRRRARRVRRTDAERGPRPRSTSGTATCTGCTCSTTPRWSRTR